MKHYVRRWFGDERGASFEGIALSVSIIAVGFVASADVLDYMTKKHGAEIGSAVQSVTRATPTAPFNPGIDYAPTASVGALHNRYVIDPCTGVMK
ncbi:hypothetical protein [Beijerinckia sp. L45]|uniref:hypothetical protein n=1 Tax=Beijerinckia sp. L45 TaxID=1641855 RepID=UPI00131C2565|nr:hypothetical protein [Beijerinckia sp. L45]